MLFPARQGILEKKEGEAMAQHMGKTAAWLTAAGLLAVLDSRYRLKTTTYTLPFVRLPAAFDGFRIVQLSDTTSRCWKRSRTRTRTQSSII